MCRLRIQESLRPRLRFLCCCVFVAAYLTLPIAGLAQVAAGAASATAGVRLPAEVQAKLDALTADLTAATESKDVAGEAKILNAVGDTYFGVSEYSEALDAYEQALADAKVALGTRQQAAALNGIGDCYRAQNQAEKALETYRQALNIAAKSGDLGGRATALNGLGWVSANIGQNEKALEYHNQALLLARQAGDRGLEATILRRLAAVYARLGESKKALNDSNQALPMLREAGDRVGEAATLHGMGSIYHDLGENQKALDYQNQALLIWRQTGGRKGEADTLNSIGAVYADLGENQKALDYYNQALPISRQVGDRVGEAAALTNIGNAYSELGENQKALDYYNQALPVSRQLGDRRGEATVLSDVGDLYADLDENQKALEYDNQALPIWREVGDRAGEALTLTNSGYAYYQLSQHQKALDYYHQALSITRRVGDRRTEARTLFDIGLVYAELGRNQRALSYFYLALPITRQVGDRVAEADTLTCIGHAYAGLGAKQKALDYLSRALPIAAFVNEPLHQVDVLEYFFDLEKVDRPSLAILYGKLAINLLQQLRGNINGLQNDVQKTFLASIADQYHDLATLLIKEGRLSEAQQVLNLLKDQEYKDYVRGETGETLGSLSLTPAEQRAEEDYQVSTAKVVEQGRRWSELKQNKARTPDEDREFQQLSDSVGKASQLMNDYFARLYMLFSNGGDANRQVADITDETATLKEQIAKMPHTVALYTVVSKERYSVIVIAGPTMVAREYAIPATELYKKVAAFRQIVLDPSKDPKPLARELYEILIGPIQADLDQAKAQTLIWSLDGVLRYVPFAALYDGQHYLIENYSLANFTPVSIARISEKPDLSAVRAVGMGISVKLEEKLQPLPMVKTELESIVNDPQMKGATGVMPGTILLNAQFTEPAMEKQLDGQRSIVHIASHFVMRPGDDSQSYLLMAGKDGDGADYHMTVADFRDNQKMSLEGTELLTLSACDTGIGGSSANGREVDGLATTAQRKGAKAVISSLWQLNDNSTAGLMSDFYKRWIDGGGKVMKAEALRQAQIDLLKGRLVSHAGSSAADAGTSYAQPYYWAPFVLMGNWQ
jgi:CHAT domain-containing protein/Tfp pilus assembly protein PilF